MHALLSLDVKKSLYIVLYIIHESFFKLLLSNPVGPYAYAHTLTTVSSQLKQQEWPFDGALREANFKVRLNFSELCALL